MLRRKSKYNISDAPTIRSEMVRNLYINLYYELYKYIWDIKMIDQIANLEIECYKLFPDAIGIRKCINNIKYLASDTIKEDNELKETIKDFEDILDYENKDFVYPIKYAKEVVTYENN